MLATIFVNKPFSKNKLFQVCVCLVLLLFSSNFTSYNILIPFRSTLRHLVFGLLAGFFLLLGLVQDFDYLLYGASTGSHVSTIGSLKRCSISNITLTKFRVMLPFYLICR